MKFLGRVLAGIIVLPIMAVVVAILFVATAIFAPNAAIVIFFHDLGKGHCRVNIILLGPQDQEGNAIRVPG